ncbi:MAG: hypothetical protein AUJ89_05225 [Candidatus Omnitrophica bacterium CG1_02_43_210]|nr:MAG: hypothetical protein AUJ89_05225 [Candidatus Omnitrophica bacterium CG1_02_43_210]
MKYLIVYASAGAGHRKAAEAIHEALLERVDKKDVAIIDSLDYTNAFFRWIYARKYITFVNDLPNIWGFFYYLLNIRLIYRLIRFPRRVVNVLNCRRFEDFVLKNRPDVVISTHFMANEIVAHLKRNNKINCRLYSAVTDYRMHFFWVTLGVDCYFVAAEQTRKDLIGCGISKDKIFVTGIPISPKFSVSLNKQDVKSKFGLDASLFTALIIGGGFGVGPVEELVKKIGALKIDLQLLVVCGYNEKLREKIKLLADSFNIKAKAYGFVDNIHELMSASDILVTKSGGLTSAEAMAKALPTVFVSPIPGQEERNSSFLQANNAAFIAEDVDSASEKIKWIIQARGELGKMGIAAAKMARPDSAKDIVNIICTQM